MEQKWIGKTNNEGNIYVQEQNLTMKDFYENCLSLNSDKPFNEIYSKPSLRLNKSECDFYINLSGTSQPCNNEIENIHVNNKNFARYIKRITNLPISIVGNCTSNTWFWNFILPEASNQSGTLPTRAPRSGSGDYNTGGVTVGTNINIYSGGKFTSNGSKLMLSYNESDSIKMRISMTFETVNGNSISEYSNASLSVSGASKYVSLESFARQYTVNFTEDFINRPFNVVHIQQIRTQFYDPNNGTHHACINVGHPIDTNIWYTTAHPTSKSMYNLVYSNSSNIKVAYGQGEYDVTWGFPFVGGGANPINCAAYFID